MTDVGAEMIGNTAAVGTAPKVAESPEEARERRRAEIVAEASARAKATVNEREIAAAKRATEAAGTRMQTAMVAAAERFPGYQNLPPAIAEKAVAAANKIHAHCGNAAKAMVEVGITLIEIRDTPEMKGCFLAWLEAEFPMSRRTAYRLMEFAEHYRGRPRRFANLANFPFSVLYKLMSPSVSDAVADEVERQAAAGKRVTVADIQRLVDEASAVIDLPSSEYGPAEPTEAVEPEAVEPTEPDGVETVETVEPADIDSIVVKYSEADPPTGALAEEIRIEQEKRRAMESADTLSATILAARGVLRASLDLPHDPDVVSHWAEAYEAVKLISKELEHYHNDARRAVA